MAYSSVGLGCADCHISISFGWNAEVTYRLSAKQRVGL
jgi:hypothetical protein